LKPIRCLKSRFIDICNLLGKLSFVRFLNIFKVFASYYFSRITGKVHHRGKPFTVSIEPTTACNLHCPECPSGLGILTRPTGTMSMELFHSVIDQAWPEMFYLNLYFQGEPYLNPKFFGMVKDAKEKKIYTATSTNGHFLSDSNARKTVESGLDRLVVSLDGTDQSSYEKYRAGGSFQQVTNGIRNIVRWKKELKSSKPFLIIQFIILRSNEHLVGEMKKLAFELGADRLKLKTAQFYEYEHGNSLMPGTSSFSRYKRTGNNKFKIKSTLPDHCLRMWRGSVITWDGFVAPCCFDKDASWRMGDLKESPFNDIWNGENYRGFREKVFTARKEIAICNNCTAK
jgi:radical SAM protein with 4Fe4S-binding SPASM domain